MPYPDEHSARVKDPGSFQTDSFRRKEVTEGVSIIMGRLKGETTMTAQAYRFAKSKFTAAEAKTWCKEHNVKYISFEAATGESKTEESAPVVESDSGLIRVEDFDTFGTPESADLCAMRVVEDAQHNPAAGDYHIIIVEAGRNEQKRRIYTDGALESLPAEPYTGLPMHLDHDQADNGKEIRVRSVRDRASVITKSWVIPARESAIKHAQVHGIAHVFPDVPGFTDNMRDPLYRQTVFTSHIVDFKGYRGRESGAANGPLWDVITEIPKRHGVDWVTSGGARGRVAESDKHESGAEAPTGADVEEWFKTLTREALAQERPDLVQEITAAAVTEFKSTVSEEAEVTKLKADLVTATKTATDATVKLRDIEIGSAVRETVTAQISGIPESVHNSVIERVTEQVKRMPSEKIAGEALKATVIEKVKAESNFIAAARGKPTVAIPGSKTEVDGEKLAGRARVEELARGLL